MHDRSSKDEKRQRGPAPPVAAMVDSASGDEADALPGLSKNEHAAALGRLGGVKGGPARAKKLTPEQRHEIARKAAAARWSKRRV